MATSAESRRRLLGTSDPRTLLAICVFVLNCVAGLPSQLCAALSRVGADGQPAHAEARSAVAPDRGAADDAREPARGDGGRDCRDAGSVRHAQLTVLTPQDQRVRSGAQGPRAVRARVHMPGLVRRTELAEADHRARTRSRRDRKSSCSISSTRICAIARIAIRRPPRPPHQRVHASSSSARRMSGTDRRRSRRWPSPSRRRAARKSTRGSRRPSCRTSRRRSSRCSVRGRRCDSSDAAALLASEVRPPARSVSPAAARLRRELVRLIGVVAWQSPADQDRVRQLDGLPLLLSLTRIDDRNPCARSHRRPS